MNFWKSADYPDEDVAEFQKMALSDLSEHFWNALDGSDELKNSFSTYMEGHFTGVRDLPNECVQLLNCAWRYMYTLNYDDAIEGARYNAWTLTR